MKALDIVGILSFDVVCTVSPVVILQKSKQQVEGRIAVKQVRLPTPADILVDI